MKEDILSGFSAVYGEISKGGNEDEKGFVDFDTEEDIVEDDEVVVEDELEDAEEVDEEIDEESSEEADDENVDDEPVDEPGIVFLRGRRRAAAWRGDDFSWISWLCADLHWHSAGAGPC